MAFLDFSALITKIAAAAKTWPTREMAQARVR